MSAFPPLGVLILLIIQGHLTLRWLANRLTGDRVMQQAVLVSFGLRVALALALFAISWWGWPILTRLQAPGGFWMFGIDGTVYHYYGAQVATAWTTATELPNPEGLAIEYFLVVGAVYRFFGSYPLYPILLNCWISAMTGLLAYGMARRYVDQRAARLCGILTSFWPSSLLWSAQLLKDSLSLWLLFATLALIMRVASGISDAQPQRWARVVLRYLLVALLVVTVTRVRVYLGSVLLATSLLVFVPTAVLAFVRRNVRRAVGYGGLALFVIVPILFARTINTWQLFSPAHPELGHYRLAMMYWRQERLTFAEAELLQTVALNSTYRDGYLSLGAVQARLEQFEEALKSYQTYLRLEPDPDKLRSVQPVAARLYVALGGQRIQQGELELAASAYQTAVALDEDLASAYAGLGTVWAKQGRFDMANTMFDKALLVTRTPSQREQILALRHRLVITEMLVQDMQRGAWIAKESDDQTQFLDAMQLSPGYAAAAIVHAADAEVSATLSTSGVSVPKVEPTAVVAFAGSPSVTRILPRETSKTSSLVSAVLARLEPPKLSEAELVPMSVTRLPTSAKQVEPPAAQQPPQRMYQLVQGASQIDRQAVATASEATPEALHARRTGFVSTGGRALMDPKVVISSPRLLLTYLPRALMIGLLAPFPSQWFDIQGSTGIMRTLAGVEMLCIYLLVPGLLVGVGRVFRSRRPELCFVAVYAGVMAVALSLVVANVGTLFRLRLQFMMPLLLIAVMGRPLELYGCFLAWLGQRSRARVGQPVEAVVND